MPRPYIINYQLSIIYRQGKRSNLAIALVEYV